LKLEKQNTKTIYDKTDQHFKLIPMDNGFRLSDYAQQYDFVHRPFEDKGVKQKKDRDEYLKSKNGVLD